MANGSSSNRVVFIDRDGTIIVEPPDEQIDTLEKLVFVPGSIRGLRALADAGFRLVLVSNQDHLGTPRYPQRSFDLIQSKILQLLAGEGVTFDALFICPHGKDENCPCRKPRTGLVDDFVRSNQIDLSRSVVFGDRETDVEFGRNLGCMTLRLAPAGTATRADILVASFMEACDAIVRPPRRAVIERRTSETTISGSVMLDGTGTYAVATGLGFFDHMLEQLAKHALIDLHLTVQGDLQIDEHHTVEDTGLAIGEAIRSALGEKRGIGRYGFVLPMDESEARVSIDLSGRPFLLFEAAFERERVGELPTELVEDFFRALADTLRATIHISVTGRNDHHKIEAIFKGFARSLRSALARDERTAGILPSTKGTL